MQGTHRKNIHQRTELHQVGTSGREERVCCQSHNRLLSSFNVALSLNPCLPPISIRLLLFPSRHQLRLQPHFFAGSAHLSFPSHAVHTRSHHPHPTAAVPTVPPTQPTCCPLPSSPHQYFPRTFSCRPLVLSQHWGLRTWCALLLFTKSRRALGVSP